MSATLALPIRPHTLSAPAFGIAALTATACLFCLVRTLLLFGTHEAFVGEVFDVAADLASRPVAWIDGGFAHCDLLDGVPRRDQHATPK